MLVVTVAHPVPRKVTDFVDYTGRTNAQFVETIQPRVTGYLVKTHFKEGSEVKKGDVLFDVDPRPYDAQYKAVQAQVKQNEAAVRYAKATNQRFKELAKKSPGAVSERELDQYQALEDQAEANLEVVRANLISAQLNLEWTQVKSPIDGLISRYLLTEGNLVNQDSTQLTTVVSMDPMYVYFDMDEPTMQELNRKEMKVYMGLQGDEGFPHEGIVNFYDNQVNPGTDSLAVRGVFKNPKSKTKAGHLFVAGMFVRVHLPKSEPYDASLVIDRAITSNQGLKYVYVVDGNNKVKQRQVSLGPLQPDGLRVVNQGLAKDDWVVIAGLQQVRPDMEVQPDYWKMGEFGKPATPIDEKNKTDKGKSKK